MFGLNCTGICHTVLGKFLYCSSFPLLWVRSYFKLQCPPPTHRHTYTGAHTHAHTEAHAHAHTDTGTLARTHTHTHAHTHAQTGTHAVTDVTTHLPHRDPCPVLCWAFDSPALRLQQE